MEYQEVKAYVQKVYSSRREALNVFEALYPDVTPVLFSATDEIDQKIFVAQWEKLIAVLSDVEYSLVIIENPQEGIENAE